MVNYNDSIAVATQINNLAIGASEDVKAHLSMLALSLIESDSLLFGDKDLNSEYCYAVAKSAYSFYVKGGISSMLTTVVNGDSLPKPEPKPAVKRDYVVYKVQYPTAKGLARFEVFCDSKESSLVDQARLAFIRSKHTRDRSLQPMLQMLQGEHSVNQVASLMGVSIATVGNWMAHLASIS